jgi:hypothetical protein
MTNHYVFTRYLYNKDLVLESLEKSILEGLYDESAFWGYELYFSGFETEAFQKCFDVFSAYYNNYKKLEKFLRRKEKEWMSSPEKSKKDEVLAILIKNLCVRKRDLTREEPKREMYIVIDSTQIECFRTRTITPVWKTLPNVCVYDLRVSNKCEIGKPLEMLRENWLFFASYSPVWKTRILENGGLIQYEEKKVVFENEDLFEQFHEKYGFEPDEQSLETQYKCLGIRLQ